MKRLILVLVVVAMLPMASATATPPTDVTFDYTVEFGDPDVGIPDVGTFSATGSAVVDELMCPGGTLEAVFFAQSKNGKNVTAVDKFVCDENEDFDGEDTFIMKAQVHIDTLGNISGNWVIMGGTGAFEGIHGTGSTDGTFIFDPFGTNEDRPGNIHLD